MDKEKFDVYEIQSQLQKEAADNQMRLYAPQLAEQQAQAQAAVILQTDPKKMVKELLLEFQGIEERNGELVLVREPTMNNLGISRLASLLRPIINDNTRFTSINDGEVRRFAHKITDDVTRDIGQHWREYGIIDRSMCDYIVDSIMIAVYSILKRAEDRNEKRWLGNMTAENIGQHKISPPKQEGFWSKLRL